MTEDEARGKWCPFVHIGPNGTVNRGFAHQPDARYEQTSCIASDCMAWREYLEPDNNGTLIQQGYCGLAGRP